MNIEVEDEELKLFHDITKELEPLHKEFQERQRKQIEEAEMEEQRFREIAQAMRSRQDPQMSASEEKEFQELREGAKEMQQELRQKLMSSIEEKEGIDRQRFQKIANAVERDPSLQKKLDELEGEASTE